jgi:hypothetical protein
MLILWIPYLIIYIWWLVKLKLHRRYKVYEFPLSGFTIELKRW